MRAFILFCVILLASSRLIAQTNTNIPATEHLGVELESLDDWVKDNLDPDALRILGKLDDKKLNLILSQLQQAMSGTNIYELGALRETARECIPVLQKYEATVSYGDWLQSQMDYLEAASEMERMVRKSSARNASSSLPAPTLKILRLYWTTALRQRGWPPLAKQYVPQLKKAFVEEHVPADLVWVAEVESSFNPNSRSPSGAAGMFQLMPETARTEKLSLWPWDERLQAEKSSRAAANYLRQLHDRYGDWELALAAYNAGPARIDKLLKHYKAHDFETIAPSLPAETQMYVPKVEATIWRREGHDLRRL